MVLMLGSSESVGSSADLFSLRDNRHKLYRKKAVSYRPITRYEVTGGYLNLPGLTNCDPSPQSMPEEPS